MKALKELIWLYVKTHRKEFMKTVLLFAGSNSSTSINRALINYTASLFKELNARVIDLRDFEPPMYSMDLEKQIGTHPKIKDLAGLIRSSDAVVLSTPEHNSMPPAFFKNILDWLSRIQKLTGEETQYLYNKPTVVMSTSGGKGGAMKSRELVKTVLGYTKPNFIGAFSLPQFHENFVDGKIINQDLDKELKNLIIQLEREVNNEN